MSLLDEIELIKWSGQTEVGDRFMDASPHTVRGDILSRRTTYTFEILAPPGLHPEDLVSALRGAKITRVMEPSKVVDELMAKLARSVKSETEQVAKAEQLAKEKQSQERELKKLRDQLNARDQEDKDNKARLDALSLIGHLMDEEALDRLVQTELNVWFRGLEGFNMTSGEAKELQEMLIRLAREAYARGEVLRDRKRCACLLEALQREGPEKARDQKEGEDQLF